MIYLHCLSVMCCSFCLISLSLSSKVRKSTKGSIAPKLLSEKNKQTKHFCNYVHTTFRPVSESVRKTHCSTIPLDTKFYTSVSRTINTITLSGFYPQTTVHVVSNIRAHLPPKIPNSVCLTVVPWNRQVLGSGHQSWSHRSA